MIGNLSQLKKKSPFCSQGTASLKGVLLVVSFCLVSMAAIGQTKLWDKTYGGTMYDVLHEMLQTNDGGYILGGTSASDKGGSKTEDSKGFRDFWVVKTDAAGNTLWDKTYGGSDYESLEVLLKTNDGGYLLGGSSFSSISGDKSEPNQGSNDIWIVKVDANGNKIWDKTFGGNAYDRLDDMVQLQDGGYLLGGTSSSSNSGTKSQNTRGGNDYWIIKIDSNGNKIWDRTIGGSKNEFLGTIEPTGDGGFLLGGSSLSGVSGDKTTPRIKVCAYECPVDAWLVKIDANGNKLWDKTYGGLNGENGESVYDIVPTKDAGFLVGTNTDAYIGGDKTSEARGQRDIWIFEIDATGNLLWDKSYGGSGDDAIRRILPTTDGGYLLGGFSSSGISGDKTDPYQNTDADEYDFWVLKVDATGTKIWDDSYGGSGDDFLFDLIPTADGNYLLGGSSASPVSGQKTQPNFGSYDYWIVKLADDALCTVPTPSIALTSTSTIYTGGHPNNLFLGYGPQSMTLTASGGTSYSWSPATGLSSTNTAQTVFTPTAAGVYTFTVTAWNGDCSATASITINVQDVRCGPKNTKVMICHKGKMICIDDNAVKAHLKNHPEDRLGDCGVNEVMAQAEKNSVQVFPNPFTNSTTIAINFPEIQEYTVEVYDLKGKLLKKWPLATARAGQEVRLDWFPKEGERGVHVVRVITKDGVQNRQVVRQ